MKKYKVGDRVFVRKDLEVGERYGVDGVDVVEEMLRYRGKIFTITNIIGWLKDSYECEEDDEVYTWSGDMFEGLVDDLEPAVTVTISDTAQLNSRLKAGDNFLDMFQYSEVTSNE